MPALRKVLIADPDVNGVRPLVKALRAHGFSVQVVADGTKALHVTVLRHPDLIVYDGACRSIEAAAFVQILASNPRTEQTPVLVTGANTPLAKPYNAEEVVSRVAQLIRRAEAGQQLKGDGRQFEGALTQLPLADLLQILAMNRRTGRLLLSDGVQRAELFVTEGRPVHAGQGEVQGEKALFRVMAWQHGNFAFRSGAPSAIVTVARTMEDALLESARQVDERRRLLGVLPTSGHRWSTSPAHTVLVDPHPVTAQVFSALEKPRDIDELLNVCSAPDLDVLAALVSLYEKGWVVAADQSPSTTREAIVHVKDAHALRGALLRSRPQTTRSLAKVLVIGDGRTTGQAFLKQLPEVEPSAPQPGCLRSSFGSLGTLPVSETLALDFVMVPAVDAARPLWRPFTSRVVGALVLEAGHDFSALVRFAAFELRLPVVVVSGTPSGPFVGGVPSHLKGAPAGVQCIETGLRDGIGALVAAAAQQSNRNA